MKMRNMLAMLLALAICFSMASCGKKNADVPDTSAETVSNAEPETVSEVESATATQAEDTTAATEVTSADEPKVTASNKSNTNNSKKSNNTSKSGGGSDSSAKKPNGGSSSGGQSQQKPPAVEQPNKKNPELDWTQADVDAAVAEAKRYAKSKGYTVYEDSKITVQIDGNEYKTSWSSPIDTRLDYKSNAKEDLHYQIDKVNKDNGSLCFLHGDEGVGVNIFSINHGSYWEIYVVY